MNFQLLIILILFQCVSINAQDKAQENFNDTHQNPWILKCRYFPSPYLSSLGIGIEKKISSKFSILCIMNRIRFNSEKFGNHPGVILSIKPEIRYNFYGRFNHGFFVSKFLGLGNYLSTKEEELNIKDYTYNRGGLFYGVGVMIGRNISLGQKFHIDIYMGPKYRWKNETTVTVVNQIASETYETFSYWGLRMGLNINYTFN